MRTKIRDAALGLFDKRGFHGASIRDIAAEADCSLPTLYYYYKSKEQLYDTVVCEAYEQIAEQIAEQMPEGMPLADTCYFYIMQRRLMTGAEKIVLRLAAKIQMGFDGTPEGRARVLRCDAARVDRMRAELTALNAPPEFERLFFHVTEHLLQRAALGDELESDDVRGEIDLLFGILERQENHR